VIERFYVYITTDTVAQLPWRLGPLFKNGKELNSVINMLPAQRPPFKSKSFVLGSEVFDVYFTIAPYFLASKRFSMTLNSRRTSKMRQNSIIRMKPTVFASSTMCNTGNWWWATQVRTF
jgi:hypothetical protein